MIKMKEVVYYPSPFAFNKYFKRLQYVRQYVKHHDYNSLFAAIKYVCLRKASSKDYIATCELGKYKIRANTNDFQFINYEYEHEVKDYFKANFGQLNLFIDVGACLGEYSIWCALNGVPSICFEANPSNYATLQHNIKLNNVKDGVTSFNIAIAEQAKMLQFKAFANDNTGSSRPARSYDTGVINVEADSVDNILFNQNWLPTNDIDLFGSNILLKLDIEGGEVAAINGAKALISSANNIAIIFEDFEAGDDSQIRQALLNYADFEFKQLDAVNTLATKRDLHT